jgi:hypothetical protein
MDVMGPKISEKLDPDEDKLGIPVIAIIGIPLPALLIVPFLRLGFALQRQQADLTKTYSETHSRVSRPGPGRSIRTIATCGWTYGMAPWFGNAASEQELCGGRCAACRARQWVDGLKKPVLAARALNRRGPVRRQAQSQPLRCLKSA